MVTGLGLVGVGRGSIIADSGWHFVERERLTPELKEVWSAVREQTPKDALIFTDEVDETENTLGGWNTYQNASPAEPLTERRSHCGYQDDD